MRIDAQQRNERVFAACVKCFELPDLARYMDKSAVLLTSNFLFYLQLYASPHCTVRGILIWITGLVFYVKIEDVSFMCLEWHNPEMHKTVKKTFLKVKSTVDFLICRMSVLFRNFMLSESISTASPLGSVNSANCGDASWGRARACSSWLRCSGSMQQTRGTCRTGPHRSCRRSKRSTDLTCPPKRRSGCRPWTYGSPCPRSSLVSGCPPSSVSVRATLDDIGMQACRQN